MSLLADDCSGYGQNGSVATLEGKLLRKWREHFDLTLEDLGAHCDPPMGKNGVYRIETQASRLKVNTIVKMIRGIEAARDFVFSDSPKDEAGKLSRYFLGPGETEGEIIDDAVGDLQRRRRQRRAGKR